MNALSSMTPLAAIEAVAAAIETGLIKAFAVMLRLPADVSRILPDRAGTWLTLAGPAVVIATAMIVTFALARRLLRSRRIKVAAERSALAGLFGSVGLELAGLVIAIIVGRVLLLGVFGIPPGTQGLGTDLMVAVGRWLFGVTLTILLFQPAVSRLRLVAVDDVGAGMATRRIAVLLAVGYLHIVLLAAAQRGGLSFDSARLISCLVGLSLAASAVQLIVSLRRFGLTLARRLSAMAVVLMLYLSWAWGWIVADFQLYRGAVATVAALMVALVLDRGVALGIGSSDKPHVTRKLVVLRVVVAASATALMLRIVFEVWIVGVFGWLSPEQGRDFSRPLMLASAMMVIGAALAAIVHVATEAWLTLAPNGPTPDLEALLARRSAVLPIVRVVAMVSIGTAFPLLALSALGVDVTALLVVAGLVGLGLALGSQNLVKDIVAGLFFMIDDVFRLGEIIEVGGRRCRLERVNLRGMRLRDEDGTLHTVSFSALHVVTNYSRRLVRMTALVSMATIPAKSELARFCQDAGAVLRREPMINRAIVGAIGVRFNEAPDAGPSTLAFGFSIAASTADRTRSLVQRLFEETVYVAGIEALSPSVSVTVSDLSDRRAPPHPARADGAGDAFLQHPGDTMNMA